MFDNIMNFIVNIIFWGVLILFALLWIILLPLGGIKTKKVNNNSKKTSKNNISLLDLFITKKQLSGKEKLPEEHEDYDEKLKKEFIKKGEHSSYNFEEEDLEEDDFHYEDDK